jgi:hypothetical protein
MQAVAIHTEILGVSCKFCGKPIRLSKSFLKRKAAINWDAGAQELTTRVFSARCRCCHHEAIYEMDQIGNLPPAHPKWLRHRAVDSNLQVS